MDFQNGRDGRCIGSVHPVHLRPWPLLYPPHPIFAPAALKVSRAHATTTMSTNEDKLKTLIGHAKEYGFVFQSSEIYDGLSATYDYGPYGVELKNNIRRYWWEAMTKLNENIVGLDAAIFMHPLTWKASGHVDAFNDPLIDNKDSKKRYRADVLLEEHIGKYADKIEKEVAKGRNKFGDAFDEAQFRATNPNVKRAQERIDAVEGRMKAALDANDLAALRQLILDEEIKCPISGTANWTEVRQFNLMFATELGSVSGESSTIYLRPETAQGIFVNFLNVQKSARMKIPFGIAQTGKAFRNEIVARQFIFRMREFEQMEMQFFIHPSEDDKWFDYWKEERMKWYHELGIRSERLRFHEHGKDELAHYAKKAFDIEYEFPFGWKELEGIHNRTDFDLSRHMEASGKDLSYFNDQTREKFVPYIIETSAGCDRTLLVCLVDAYEEEEVKGETRVVLKFSPKIAPVKAAVFPLVNKDGMPEVATKIFHDLKMHFKCFYDDSGAVGRRYRRMDEIGTPYCITVDGQTLTDQTVTIRDRDTMMQDRVNVTQLVEWVKGRIGG